MPFYLTHQQVVHNKNHDYALFVVSGACGNYFRHLLGALPQHLPKHLDPCHSCHIPHFPSHHQAGPNQATQICQPTHESVSGTSLGCLPQKVVGFLVLPVVAIFPAFFLPLLTSCFGLLSTSTMHSVIVTRGGIICMISGESNQSLKIVINPLLQIRQPFFQEKKSWSNVA